MIILNSQKSNTNIIEIIEKYKNTLNFTSLKCPHCNSSELIKWGTYERTIIYIGDNKLEYKVLTVQRVRCKTCNKTHALLPSFIVPYKRSLLDVILSSFKNEDVTLAVSIDTITKWNKEFNQFLPYLKTMYKNILKEAIIDKIKTKIFESYEAFYKQFKKILMMTHEGIYNMAYF